jgi:Helix-turn-helix domain
VRLTAGPVSRDVGTVKVYWATPLGLDQSNDAGEEQRGATSRGTGAQLHQRAQNGGASLVERRSGVRRERISFLQVFKKSTGLTFTDYMAHARLEDARTELLNPNRRISEVAYDVGFQSLTQFNRAFKRIVGCSPTQFRESLPKRRLACPVRPVRQAERFGGA